LLSANVVAVPATGALAKADTAVTTPLPWVTAVESSEPVAPVAVAFAVASWPFSVVALACAVALPCVPVEVAEEVAAAMPETSPAPPLAVAVALTMFAPVSAIAAVAAPPAPAGTVITKVAGGAAGPASGRAVADQSGRMRGIGGDVVEGQARYRSAALTTVLPVIAGVGAYAARCGLIKAKACPRSSYRLPRW
jgi:hypothetical protein